MFARMMADAATASHEDHADVGDVDHSHPVMPGAAWQFDDTTALSCNRVGNLALQPVGAGHRAILVRDVQLQRQVAPPGDGLDLTDQVRDRAFSMRIAWRA